MFIGLQFIWPHNALGLGCLAFLVLLLDTSERRFPDAVMVLGIDATVVVASLFIVGGAVENTPIVSHFSQYLYQHRGNGLVEVVAYLLTAVISADGAAATLAPIVHNLSSGSMLSAWQLASGICAGSSVFLTSASAGPILYATCKSCGHELSFRAYARFGFPFSLAMIAIYVILNSVLT
jgi:Na+/H+ antiporter NhaD/arsenite permease-like protein